MGKKKARGFSSKKEVIRAKPKKDALISIKGPGRIRVTNTLKDGSFEIIVDQCSVSDIKVTSS